MGNTKSNSNDKFSKRRNDFYDKIESEEEMTRSLNKSPVEESKRYRQLFKTDPKASTTSSQGLAPSRLSNSQNRNSVDNNTS